MTCDAQHPEYSLVAPFFIIDKHIINIGIHACHTLCQRYGQHGDASIGKSVMQRTDGGRHENNVADKGQVDDQDVPIHSIPSSVFAHV